MCCLWCLQVVAKRLDRRLAGLGASSILETGLGDDQVYFRPPCWSGINSCVLCMYAIRACCYHQQTAYICPYSTSLQHHHPSKHRHACLECLLQLSVATVQHASGYEAALDPWLTKMWSALRSLCPLPEGVTDVS